MEEGSFLVRAFEPGEAAIRLPWLAPSTTSLVALARDDSAGVWPAVRTDPAAVLLIARHLPAEPEIPSTFFGQSGILQTALKHWREHDATAVDWSRPEVYPVRQVSLTIAAFAQCIARQTGGCDPNCAWIGGVLAPLGWLAICAVEPDAAGECLRESLLPARQTAIQRRLWGLDAASIGRRLARHWNLPYWLQTIVGYLGLPVDCLHGLGVDERLFQTVQLAAILAKEAGHDLGLAVGAEFDSLRLQIGLTEVDRHDIMHEMKSLHYPVSNRAEAGSSLLGDFLAMAIEKREFENRRVVERLDAENDRLIESVRTLRCDEGQRLQRHKLRSLAEFAAGAGHEINNPLAVISVQTQTLLLGENDAERQDGLRKIIRQTERIHQILTDLMQFAKPPVPRRAEVDLRSIVADVFASHRPEAESKTLRYEWDEPRVPALVYADASMIRTALGCLLRNAIHAAESPGFVCIELSEVDGAWVIAIENSGCGPTTRMREHLFDPFYSGRDAGRGRGLGLSTAWRLSQENGGDVRFDPRPDCPARFILALPVYPRLITPPSVQQDARRKTA